MRLFKKFVRNNRKYSKIDEIRNVLNSSKDEKEKLLGAVQVGFHFMKTSDFQTAKMFFNEAKELSKLLKQPEIEGKVLLALMEIHNSLGEFDQVFNLSKLLNFDKEKDKNNLIQYNIILGNTYLKTKDFEKSENHFLKSLNNEKDLSQLIILDTLAQVKFYQGDKNAAVNYHQQCLQIASEMDPNGFQVNYYKAKSLMHIGTHEIDSNNQEEGSKKLKEALKIAKIIGDQQLQNLILNVMNQGSLLLKEFMEKYQKARNLFDQAEFKEANIYFKECLETCKNDKTLTKEEKDLLILYISSLIYLHDFGTAHELLNYGKEIGTNDPVFLQKLISKLGKLFLFQKNLDEAQHSYEKILENGNEEFYITAKLGLAEVFLVKKDYKKAKEILNGLLFKSKNERSLLHFEELLALNELFNGDFNSAKDKYVKLLEKDKSNHSKLIVLILQQDFENQRELFIKQEMYNFLYSTKESFETLEELFQKLSDKNLLKHLIGKLIILRSQKDIKLKYGEILMENINKIQEKADEFFGNQDFYQSKIYFKTLYEIISFENINNEVILEKILSRLFESYFQLGDFKEALNYAQNLVKLSQEKKDDEKEASFLYKISECYKSLNEYKISEEKALEAIKKSKKLVLDCFSLIASLRIEQGDLNSAKEYLTNAIDLAQKENKTEIYNNLKQTLSDLDPHFYLQSANGNIKTEDYEAGIRDLEKALENDIQDLDLKVEILLKYANLQSYIKQYEKSEEILKNCEEIIENNHFQSIWGYSLYSGFGSLYCDTHQYEKSIEYFEKTLLLPVNDYRYVYDHLAIVYMYVDLESSKYYCLKGIEITEDGTFLNLYIVNRILAKNFKEAYEGITKYQNKYQTSMKYYELIVQEVINQKDSQMILDLFKISEIEPNITKKKMVSTLKDLRDFVNSKELRTKLTQKIEHYFHQ